MRILKALVAIVMIGAPLVLATPAQAETYNLVIKGGQEILKIFLDNGVARRVSAAPMSATYAVEMDPGECMTVLRLTFGGSIQGLRVPYDVCSEEGFEITRTFRRW